MKTFLMSIPERLRLNNEKLDVTALLCGKSWVVFNDEGKTQEIIFQKGGRLIMSVDGSVSNFQWEYLKENRNILLTTDSSTTMLQPSFQDENILALKVSGLERYMFLIDKKQLNSFIAKTLSELQAYFDEKNKAISDKADLGMLRFSIREELKKNEDFQHELKKHVMDIKKTVRNFIIAGVIFLVIALSLLCINDEENISTSLSVLSFIGSATLFIVACLRHDSIIDEEEKLIKNKVASIILEEQIYDRGGW